jgi:hypothetical protein
MPILRNVKISDATKTIEQGMSGNLEYKNLDLTAKAGVAAKLKKGAFYSLTDGRSKWKAMYVAGDAKMVHFQVTESH